MAELPTEPQSQAVWHQTLRELQLQRPSLFYRPDLGLCLFREEMQRPDSAPSEQTLNRLDDIIRAGQLVGWPQMAQQELAIITDQVDRLRWTILAHTTLQPPMLDGELDEAFWERAPSMQLSPLSDGDTTEPASRNTMIRWSYDSDYLYVGITAPRNPRLPSAQLVERRGYDADLSLVDHVRITLDTDRDYCTAIELAVSSDGRTYDRCCGFPEYNPKWHVCVKPAADHWAAELAIRLDHLTARPDVSGKAWAVSAGRFHPTEGAQSWSQLRTHAPQLHAGGLLLFVSPP